MNNLKKKYFCIDEKNVNTLFFINNLYSSYYEKNKKNVLTPVNTLYYHYHDLGNYYYNITNEIAGIL